MLTGILRAVGEPLDVSRIYKHTREDVLWKNAFQPWRRSPLWLCLRVALQTSLVCHDDEEPHLRYKSFMLFFMAQVLRDALKASLPSDVLFIMKAKVSGRSLKLGEIEATPWLLDVETVVKAAQQELLRRWMSVEKHRDPFGTQQHWPPSQLLFHQDTKLTLSSLRPYLAKVRARSGSQSTFHNFTPDCGRRISQCSSSLRDVNLWRGVEGSELRLQLADLELWVQDSLKDGWGQT
jgi:hypothetical protein